MTVQIPQNSFYYHKEQLCAYYRLRSTNKDTGTPAPFAVCYSGRDENIRATSRTSMGRIVGRIPNDEPDRLQRMMNAKQRLIGVGHPAAARQEPKRNLQ